MLSHLITLATTAPTTCPAPKETGSGLFGPIAKPIASVLAGVYHVIPSYGVAILVLSVVWMIIISPLTLKSTRSMLAMQKIQPEIKKLQEKHKNDRQAFAQAQMDLFKEKGVSPFGSCLPTLLPLPVFFALFRVIEGLSHKTHGCATPQFLSPHTRMFEDIVAGHGAIHSFGLNLAQNALSSHSSFAAAIPFFVLLVVMGGTQYLQTQQMMSRNPAAADNPQMKMMKYLPLVFTLICIRFPAGVVLYYSMSNLCRIAQQSLMYRFDPKVRSLAAKDVIDVEAYAEEHEQEHKSSKGGGKSTPAIARSSSAGASSADKPQARSRFSALFEAAKEQKAQQLEDKAQARSDAKGKRPSSSAGASSGGRSSDGRSSGGRPSGSTGSKGPANRGQASKPARSGSGGGGGGGSTKNRAQANRPPAKATPSNGTSSKGTPSKGTPSNGAGNGGGSKNGGNGSSSGGDNGAGAKSAGNGAGSANGDSNGSPGSRTGGGSRTGARSGGAKKRRGR